MKVLIAGDFCPQNRVSRLFEQEKYDDVLGEAKSIIKQSDYSLVNFECPVGFGEEKPIAKCGPNLQCGINGVKAIKYAGFSAVTLANNHFLDYGQEGVENTLAACRTEGLETVGGGKDLREASAILYKRIKEKTLAIINCCEHEYSIASETVGGSNPLNPIKQYYAIKEARKTADFVLVIVHGGHEHYQLPSPRMQDTYRFFVDAGADTVVNHHQHCYSGYEVYQGKPIFYGLGNFCFDMPVNHADEKWTQGYLLGLDFGGDEVSFELYPYHQCSDRPAVKMLPRNAYTSEINELNKIIGSEAQLQKSIDSYYSNSDRDIFALLRPLQNHYLRALQDRKLLPMFMSKIWLHQLRDYILCESHRDKIEHFFLNSNLLK